MHVTMSRRRGRSRCSRRPTSTRSSGKPSGGPRSPTTRTASSGSWSRSRGSPAGRPACCAPRLVVRDHLPPRRLLLLTHRPRLTRTGHAARPGRVGWAVPAGGVPVTGRSVHTQLVVTSTGRSPQLRRTVTNAACPGQPRWASSVSSRPNQIPRRRAQPGDPRRVLRVLPLCHHPHPGRLKLGDPLGQQPATILLIAEPLRDVVELLRLAAPSSPPCSAWPAGCGPSARSTVWARPATGCCAPTIRCTRCCPIRPASRTTAITTTRGGRRGTRAGRTNVLEACKGSPGRDRAASTRSMHSGQPVIPNSSGRASERSSWRSAWPPRHELAHRAAQLWSTLSRAGHHRHYELAPLVTELRAWLDAAGDVTCCLVELTEQR